MSKVSISEVAKAPVVDAPEFAGSEETRAFFKPDKDPIQVYENRLQPGGTIRIQPNPEDSISYVWEGAVEIAGQPLARGSSFIVERGASVEINAGKQPARLLTFYGRETSGQPGGGHVHLLPRERMPFEPNLHDNRVGGGMHANSEASGSSVWLHENNFAPTPPTAEQMDAEAGVHCHTEDEVIFVVEGQIQLGPRLYDRGTAVAIAANTYYSFLPGSNGLTFINFRPARPSEIRMRSGMTMDEIQYWKDRLPPPEYVTLESAAAAS